MENKNLHLQRKKTCFSLLLLISKLKKHAKEYNLLSILSTTVIPERSSGRLWCTCANERPQYLLADTLPQSNIQGIKFMLDKSICFLVPWHQTCSFLSSYKLLQSSWSKLWTFLVSLFRATGSSESCLQCPDECESNNLFFQLWFWSPPTPERNI